MSPPARQVVAQISKELSIQNATLLCFADFMDWYKSRHRYSGINYVTSDQRHNGEAGKIGEHRGRVYEQARERHPRRWTRSTRCWRQPEVVWINPYRMQRTLKPLIWL